MKKFTINDIRSWKPCYDPSKHLEENWKGTIIDILENDKIPFEDRLWVVLRTELVSERIMRLFAVWSYRQTLKFIPNPDPRSIEAANVAEKYANNEASKIELEAAESAARSAAWSAARSAAWSVVWSAAWSAAELAAWSAARSAAWSAAESAESAAWSAARSAAWSAAESAESAARSAAESAAKNSQKEKLIEMIKTEQL